MVKDERPRIPHMDPTIYFTILMVITMRSIRAIAGRAGYYAKPEFASEFGRRWLAALCAGSNRRRLIGQLRLHPGPQAIGVGDHNLPVTALYKL